MTSALPEAPRLLHTLAWASAGRLAAQGIAWVATIWVMRLLGPSDYGVMAMAMIAVSAFQLFEEGGLGTMIVRAPQLDDILVRKVFGLVLVLGVVLCGAMLASAKTLASALGNAAVAPLLRVLAILLVTGSLIVVPRSLLERRLAFRRIAAAEIAGALLASAATLTLALRGAGVWALVVGALVQSVVRATGLNVASPPPGWPLFSVRGLADALRFGGAVTTERVIWYLYSQADVFIAGRVLGSQATGLYVVGKELAELPAEKLAPGMQQVVLPALARIQEDRPELGARLRQGIGVMSFIAFPIFFGLAAVAGDLIPLILGSRWNGATLPLSAYAVTLPLGLVSGVLLSALKAVGRADVSLRNVLLGAGIMLAGFAVGVRWGVTGLALTWVVAYPIYFLSTVLRSVPHLGMKASSVARSMIGPFLSSLTMLLVVSVFRRWTPTLEVGQVLRMAAAILVGVATYIALALVALRPAVSDVLGLLRGWRGKRP